MDMASTKVTLFDLPLGTWFQYANTKFNAADLYIKITDGVDSGTYGSGDTLYACVNLATGTKHQHWKPYDKDAQAAYEVQVVSAESKAHILRKLAQSLEK